MKKFRVKNIPGYFDSQASADAYSNGTWEKYCAERREKQDYTPFHIMDEIEIMVPWIVESTHDGIKDSEEYANYIMRFNWE